MIKDDTTQAQVPQEERTKLKEHHDKFLEYLQTRDFKGLIQVSEFFKKWLSSQENSSFGTPTEIIDLIPHLLTPLSDDFLEHETLQIVITELLARISAGTSKEAQKIADSGAIPVLAHAFSSAYNGDIQESIMRTLANIAGESNLHYRDQILDQGVLDMVIKSLGLRPQKILYYRTAAWLISNLVRGEPFPSYSKVEKTFGALTHLIEYPDDVIQQYTLLCLTYLSEEAKESHVKSIAENSLITKIVQCISSKNEKVAINALKAASNLARGGRFLLHNLYDEKLFKALPKVLESTNTELRRNACIMLSNMLSNEFDDHDYLDDYEVLEALIKLAASDDEMDIRAQATLCLEKYFESATNEYAMIAIEKGAFEAFLQNLQETDVKVIESSLRASYKALEYGENTRDENGGINFIASKIVETGFNQLIESLQTHPSKDISHQAEILCRKFLETDP